MLRNLLALAMVLVLATPALAELSDDQYVSQYFGTSAVFTTTTRLVDPNVGYWTDKLPQQLNSYDWGFVVGVVNTLRSTKGVTPLLDINTAQVLPGWEEELEGYGYKYNIDFVDMRPSEVQAVFTALGGLEKLLPGVNVSYAPLLVRNYWASNTNLDDPVLLTIGTQELKIMTGTPIREIQQMVQGALRESYSQDVLVDVSVDEYLQQEASGLSISVTATIPAG